MLMQTVVCVTILNRNERAANNRSIRIAGFTLLTHFFRYLKYTYNMAAFYDSDVSDVVAPHVYWQAYGAV